MNTDNLGVKNSPSLEEAPLLIEILEMLTNEANDLRFNVDSLESSLDRLAPVAPSDMMPEVCRPYEEVTTITEKIIGISRHITSARHRLRECNTRISKLF